MPTLTEVAGTTYPSEFDGRDVTRAAGESFAPLFRTTAFPFNRSLLWEHTGNAATRQCTWKVVRTRGQSWGRHNLEDDRGERHNVASEHAEVVTRMTPAWKGLARAVGAAQKRTSTNARSGRSRNQAMIS